VVLAEVYPSLLAAEVTAACGTDPTLPRNRKGPIKDSAQVKLLAGALARLSREGRLDPLLAPDAEAATLREEGWILGVGHESALRAAAAPAPLAPPPLRDDCFALPAGVDWTPVDEALRRLRARLAPMTAVETIPVETAAGRTLAADAIATRANPPAPNAAVDGWGFAAAATGAGPQTLPVVPGRAAAGAPFAGVVPFGAAVRILTGATLPPGVDTVVLDEDATTDGARVAFHGPVKPRANTRKAGEDVAAGETLLRAGHVLRPPDLALLAAAGAPVAAVRRRLRVGVLSTGDEVLRAAPPGALPEGRIADANGPMLRGLASAWGCETVDLGHVGDDRAALAERLDDAAGRCEAILTSGGASAGDEDHVSALLAARGTLHAWRIAMKPGRPLALGLWRGAAVFGLPGNPVAAFVCALVFARPALARLGGADWPTPAGFTVPAAFAKDKRAGRREYLRARLTPEGAAEAFRSEGSGRISGLAWATGLVELDDGAARIAPGDPVRFLPFASFGL
jgi:molybdopterin molybdotransferase